MRTSAPGGTRAPTGPGTQAGFSLLEMMVVLLIIGIATGLASVAAFGHEGERALRHEAQRLARLFALAQVEARAGGQPIVWTYDAQGYGFARLPGSLVLSPRLAARARAQQPPLSQANTALRRRDWPDGAAIEVHIPSGTDLVFDTEWVHAPFQVELRSGAYGARIARLDDGHFVVRP